MYTYIWNKFGSIVSNSISQVLSIELPIAILLGANYKKTLIPGEIGNYKAINHFVSAFTRQSIKAIAEDYFDITKENHPWLHKGVSATAGLIGGGLKYGLNKGFTSWNVIAGGINAALYELSSDSGEFAPVMIEAIDSFLLTKEVDQDKIVNAVIQGATIGAIVSGSAELFYNTTLSGINAITDVLSLKWLQENSVSTTVPQQNSTSIVNNEGNNDLSYDSHNELNQDNADVANTDL